MKTLFLFAILTFTSAAFAQVNGKCDLTAKSHLTVKLSGDAFQIGLNKKSCSAVITKAVNLDRGPLQKEIFYVDLKACDQKLFRKTGFIKFQKLTKSVKGLANLVTEGPVSCEFKADWDKLKELSAKNH